MRGSATAPNNHCASARRESSPLPIVIRYRPRPASVSRTHAGSFEPLRNTIEIAGMPRRARPDIRDRHARAGLQNLGHTAPRFLRPTGDDIGRRQEVIDKHRPGILRHCAIEPADRFDVPARVERSGGNPVTAEEMQTIDASQSRQQRGRRRSWWRPDCVAGHVRLELRNVVANYPFESSRGFPGSEPNSGHRDHSRLRCSAGGTQLGPGAASRGRPRAHVGHIAELTRKLARDLCRSKDDPPAAKPGHHCAVRMRDLATDGDESAPNVQVVNESPTYYPAMSPENRRRLADRIAKAAEASLAAQNYVSPVDVLVGIGWLDAGAVKRWRQGQVDYLERVVQTNLSRISEAMKLFRSWATAKGLIPSEASYVARTPSRQTLRFSKSGPPTIERLYRTHWLSGELSQRKQERLAEKASRAPELVVIRPLNAAWTCHRCG